MTTSAPVNLRPRPCRRWLRRLLIATAALAVLGSVSAYAGYQMMFRKNPEVVRQMRAAEQRQQDIESAFNAPADGT